jgi:hypothetical protein
MRNLAIGLLILLAGVAARASTPVDQTLFTTYTLSRDSQSIEYVVCGSTSESDGCYASGSLGPFGRVGAVIQGHAGYSGDVAVRDIYVLDVASGTGRTGVTLSVWRKTDTVSALSDSVQVEFVRSVSLPLTGGARANCYVVENTSFLYVGTDQGGIAVQVRKSNLALIPEGGSVDVQYPHRHRCDAPCAGSSAARGALRPGTGRLDDGASGHALHQLFLRVRIPDQSRL